MKKNQRSISDAYKAHIIKISSLITCIIVAIFFISFVYLNASNANSRLIDNLSKQEMYIQIITKDIGRIYEINSIINGSSYTEVKKEELINTRSKVSTELREMIKDYEKSDTLKEGYIIVDDNKISIHEAMKKLEPSLLKKENLWTQFKTALETIENSSDIYSEDTLNALQYINESNRAIIENSDKITNIILDYNGSKNLSIFYTIMFLIVLLLIMLAKFIRNAYKDLFIPISQLSNGISQLGIIEEDNAATIEEENDLPMYSEIQTVFNELKSILSLIENLNRNTDFKDILHYIFHSFSKYIPYTHIGVSLISDDKKYITASYAVSSKYNKDLAKKLIGFNALISSTSLSTIINTEKERIINDLEEYVKGKPIKKYNNLLLDSGIKSSITFPLKNDKEVIGIIFFSSNKKNIYRKTHIEFLKILANSIALSLEKSIFMQDMVISSTLALAKLAEERDTETGEHLQRMKIYSRMIAQFLSKEEGYRDFIDLDYINNIERFAPLHDIGKVAIRDDILLKPGKLTKEEFEIMKTHTIYGAKVLKMADDNLKKRGKSIFSMSIDIAEGHHEKWDGSGYPHGKSGGEIPLSARIVALGDVLDALTSRRPYKEPFTFEDSINIIIEGSGKHFDPYIVEIFLKNLPLIKEKYLEFNLGSY